MTRFFQVTLRTTDVDSARAFYAALLGGPAPDLVPLHEQAIARGARPHWFGFLDVGEVEPAAAAFAARGATPMGPKWVDPQGLENAPMRDPGGAILGLARPPPQVDPKLGPEVVWYALNTPDVERAKATYGEQFGWELKPPEDLGTLGLIHPFSWEPGSPAIGSMSDIRGRPGVHPHWLFQFRVAALGPAMDAVRAGGGKVLGPYTLLTGEQFAVCDDPQGAAFGIRTMR